MALYSAALVGGPPWGFRVASYDQESNYAVFVAQVIPGSRADNEHIQLGDVLVTVNGKDVAGLELHEVQRLLKRSTGIIRLTLHRNGSRPPSQSAQGRYTPVRFTDTPPIRIDTASRIDTVPRIDTSSKTDTAPRYRRVRKRISASGDIDFSYSSEIEDTPTDYSYRRAELRPASAQGGFYSGMSEKEHSPMRPPPMAEAPDASWRSYPEVHSEPGAWNSLSTQQFSPLTISSAPVSPVPSQSTVYTRRTVTTRRRTVEREPQMYLTPESIYSQQTSDGSITELVRDEGSLTPKAPIASSSSTTPVIMDNQTVQQSSLPATSVDVVHDRQEDSLAPPTDEKMVPPSTDQQTVPQSSNQKMVPPSSDQQMVPSPGTELTNGHPPREYTQDGFQHAEAQQGQSPPSAETSIPHRLPDEVAFCGGSICSDHPSLRTSSLGMGSNDRGSSRTGSLMSDYLESITKAFEPIERPRSPDLQYAPTDYPTSVQSKTSEDTPSVQEIGDSAAVKDVHDLSEGKDAAEHEAERTPVEQESQENSKTGQMEMQNQNSEKKEPEEHGRKETEQLFSSTAEPHYPRAFEQQDVIQVNAAKSVPSSAGTTDMSSGVITNTNESNLSSSLRGPTFKATHPPAIWSPKATPVKTNDIRNSETFQEDVPSSTVQCSGSSQMPCYAPPYSDSVIQSPNEQRMESTATTTPAAAPPPPPPPPPPPATGRYASSVQAAKEAIEAAEAAAAADPNRSVVEYPEKQSVASLRSAIATKFNGTAPIKGYLRSPGSEAELLKERDMNMENESYRQPMQQQHYPPSDTDSSARPIQTYQQAAPPPRPPQPSYQMLDATKNVENAASNLMSSVVGEQENIPFVHQQQRQEDPRSYGKPLSVTTAPGPGKWPPAPSPTPPALPPAPAGFTMQPSPTMSSSSLASSGFRYGGRPDNFARPYERTSIRGTDTTPHHGDHYAIPYRETTTVTRRRVRHGDGNYKYDDVGPVDASGTPLGLREMVPSNDQHQWYKMMYKKMHQIDRKDDPSVLRYRIRDTVADRYFGERSPQRRFGSSAGSSPQRVGYKFAEYLADLPQAEDEEPGSMDFEKPYTPKPFNIFEGRPSRNPERDVYGRPNRSQSANRYDMLATPPPSMSYTSHPLPPPAPVQQPKPDLTTSRPYQYQAPRQTEKYTSIASSTQEQEQMRRRVELLSNRPQSAVAFGSRYDREPRGGVQEYAAATPRTYVQTRPLSPMRRDEARQWYQNVQSGGEAPFTGFRQPAPPRRDSLFSSAWYATVLSKHRRRTISSNRDISVQTRTSSNRPHDSRRATDLNRPKRLAFYQSTYQHRSIHPRPTLVSRRNTDSADFDQPWTMRRTTSSSMTTGKTTPFASPVRASDGGSNLYALERLKTKDFHLPSFRLSPSKDQLLSEDLDWYWISNGYSEDIPIPGAKRVDVNGGKKDYELKWNDYEELMARRQSQEDEFRRACQFLQEALKDIERVTSQKRSGRWGTNEIGEKKSQDKKTSCGCVSNGSRRIQRYYSTPNNLDSSTRNLSGSGVLQEKDDSDLSASLLQSTKRPLSLPDLSRSPIFISSCITLAVNSVIRQGIGRSTHCGDWEGRRSLSERSCHFKASYCSWIPSTSIGRASNLKKQSCPDCKTDSNNRTLELPVYASTDVSSSHVRPNNGKFDFDMDEFSRLEKELSQEEERRKQQLKELEDQKARWQMYGTSTPSQQFSPAVQQPPAGQFSSAVQQPPAGQFSSSVQQPPSGQFFSPAQQPPSGQYFSPPNPQPPTQQQPPNQRQFSPAVQQQPSGIELRGVAKALHNFVAQTNKELSFRKGDLIKVHRQVDDNWYEGEVHGRVGILPVSYVDLAATAQGDDRATLTEVSTKAEGLGQAVFNFEGKNANELPLIKGEYIVLTKQIDPNWMEGKNSFGRAGIFPSKYVKIIEQPTSKSTDYVTHGQYTAPGQSQPFMSSGDHSSGRTLQNGPPPPGAARNLVSNSVGAGRNRATAPPQQLSDAAGAASNENLLWKARDLTQNARKQFGSTAGGGAEALDAALAAGAPDTFQALFPYRPQNPDELELKENDIVYVVEKCDDGWFIGTSLRSGRFGTFPGNYVKRL